MILIVESGATKTDWCLCAGRPGDDGHQCRKFRTAGFNAATMDAGSLCRMIEEIPSNFGCGCADRISEIYFYAAGLVSETPPPALVSAFSGHFRNASVMEFASDLIAAARALFGDSEGVAAIMGTGSNSCLYNGSSVVKCYRPGGFVLGDEGSAASLGRMFLADYFKELVPRSLASEFSMAFPDVTYASAVHNIYKGEKPSAYMASFAPFVTMHLDEPYAAALVENNVRAFIERSLSRYGCKRVGVCGSFGIACREVIEKAGASFGLEFTDFIQAPIDRLVYYHSK